MNTKLLDTKLKNLATQYEALIIEGTMDIKSIHNLRTKTRELLSFVDQEDRFYPRLKKVIKSTNEIRDIDVFISMFLKKLPNKLQESLSMEEIILDLNKLREVCIVDLIVYLKHLTFPNVINYATKENIEVAKKLKVKKANLCLSKKELHKYRIYIKKQLYNYKNFYPDQKDTIKLLTKMKDNLGFINDNYNALERLEELEYINLEPLEEYVKEQNNSYFQKVQKLESKWKKVA